MGGANIGNNHVRDNRGQTRWEAIRNSEKKAGRDLSKPGEPKAGRTVTGRPRDKEGQNSLGLLVKTLVKRRGVLARVGPNTSQTM